MPPSNASLFTISFGRWLFNTFSLLPIHAGSGTEPWSYKSFHILVRTFQNYFLHTTKLLVVLLFDIALFCLNIDSHPKYRDSYVFINYNLYFKLSWGSQDQFVILDLSAPWGDQTPACTASWHKAGQGKAARTFFFICAAFAWLWSLIGADAKNSTVCHPSWRTLYARVFYLRPIRIPCRQQNTQRKYFICQIFQFSPWAKQVRISFLWNEYNNCSASGKPLVKNDEQSKRSCKYIIREKSQILDYYINHLQEPLHFQSRSALRMVKQLM